MMNDSVHEGEKLVEVCAVLIHGLSFFMLFVKRGGQLILQNNYECTLESR